jgi:AraC family transcriptional regulator, transcriptional activator of pobA
LGANSTGLVGGGMAIFKLGWVVEGKSHAHATLTQCSIGNGFNCGQEISTLRRSTRDGRLRRLSRRNEEEHVRFCGMLPSLEEARESISEPDSISFKKLKKLKFERNKYGKELLMDACNEQELEIVADTMVLNFYTIVFLEKCRGTYFLDTEEIEFQDNTVLFVKPGQINKVDKVIFEKCHFLFFEGDFLDEFFNDKDFIFKFGFFHNHESPSFLKFEDAGSFQAFNQIAFEIWQEIKNLTQDSHHILRSQIYYLLVKLHRAYSQRYGQARDTMTDPVVQQFSRLLDKEVRTNLTVNQFAERLNVSRVHLMSIPE